MTEDQIQLAYDRGVLAGRRMAHLADKVGQDTKNLRECAARLIAAKHQAHGDYLNGLAEGLEKLGDGGA